MINKTIDTLYVGAKVFLRIIYKKSTQSNFTLTLYLWTPIKIEINYNKFNVGVISYGFIILQNVIPLTL